MVSYKHLIGVITLPNAMRPPVFDIPELPEDFPF